MIFTSPLTARKVNDDPPGYRVIFDDGTGPVEVGSISEKTRHTQSQVYWHWGIDALPRRRRRVAMGVGRA